MFEAYEFQMIVAESYADDTERYWFLRNGELDEQIIHELVEEALQEN